MFFNLKKNLGDIDRINKPCLKSNSCEKNSKTTHK